MLLFDSLCPCFWSMMIFAHVLGTPEQKDNDERIVIATVNGQIISASDIQIPLKSTKLSKVFENSYGRAPDSSTDWDKAIELKKEMEIKKLSASIRFLIRQQQIEKLEVPEPSDAEVEDRLQEVFEEAAHEQGNWAADPKARIEKQRETIRLLLQAYREVLDEGQDPVMVYRKWLSGVMSEESWRLRLKHEGIPERRKELERFLTIPDEELYRIDSARRGIKDLLIAQHLDKAIEKEIIRIDEEYREYKELLKTDPANPKVQSKGPMYLRGKIYEWWQQRYREADVKILDERYQSAWPPDGQ